MRLDCTRKGMKNAGRVIFAIILAAGMLKAVTYDRQVKMRDDEAYDWFGNSVSNAGDVNGDGYDDIIVGAEDKYIGGKPDAGVAYIYFGGPSMDSIPDVILVGDTAYDYFGTSVSGAGDVNGDGYDDVIVGADGKDIGGNLNAGAAYIYFGGPSMDSIPDVILAGDTADDYFGTSVSGAGDVNGDGYDDVIVGADEKDIGGNSDVGAAYIFFGSPNMDSIPDVVLVGDSKDGYFGCSVSGAGDVNGDGYDDVIVGEEGRDSTKGAAFIFYGGQSMDSIDDISSYGAQNGQYLGCSVSGAGDVNGDGYDEVIIGEKGYNFEGNTEAGAAIILFNDLHSIFMGGEAAYDEFGTSVSGAGDVNGDGYDDVIVGAKYANAIGASNTGGAYIFFGGSSMDSIYDVKIYGKAQWDFFGCSVSGAGDVNGDGYNDVIVGAEYADENHGAAYLYDFFMFKILSPKGGEVWNVGANEKIIWEGKDYADLYISTDGGNTWNKIGDDLQPPEDTNLNTFTFRVPHIPTRYAMVKVVKHWYDATEIKQAAQSDSFFTIRSTINLLKFEAESEDNNKVKLTWNTDPGLDVLAGYNLYRIKSNGTREKVNTDLIKTLNYEDTKSADITGYELGAVNGLGEEYRIGEVEFYTMKKPLEITPSIVNGKVTIRYFVPDNFSHTPQKVSVSIYSINGQLVRNIYSGMAKHGTHSIVVKDLSLPAGSYVCVVNIGGKKAYTQGFQVMR